MKQLLPMALHPRRTFRNNPLLSKRRQKKKGPEQLLAPPVPSYIERQSIPSPTPWDRIFNRTIARNLPKSRGKPASRGRPERPVVMRASNYFLPFLPFLPFLAGASLTAIWAAASRAIGTRNGEQDT